MIKGAIFDLDGTLLDSMVLWDTLGERYLLSIGQKPHEDLRETFKTSSLKQAADYLKKEYSLSFSVSEIMNGINSLAEHFYYHEASLKAGVKVFLAFLKDNGVKMCIATATDKYLAEAALKRCGIDKYFSEIFTCTEIGHGKDEPIIFQEALGHLGTEKNETFVFEDALYAIKTAKKYGFKIAAVYDEYSKEQAEIKELADIYIEDFAKINDFKKFASNL